MKYKRVIDRTLYATGDLHHLREQVGAIDTSGFTPIKERQDKAVSPMELLSSGFHECLGAEVQDVATVFGFITAAAARCWSAIGKPVLLCSLSGNTQEYGALYAAGLSGYGLSVDDLLYVEVKKEQELYWVAEESLTSRALSAIILFGSDREKLYDFTISRRLKLRVDTGDTALYFMRNWKQSGATAAHARWRISRMNSSENQLSVPGTALLGDSCFRLQLEKPIFSGSQAWECVYDKTCGFRLADPLAYRPSGKAGSLWWAA